MTSQLPVLYATVGLTALVLALVSRSVRRLPLSEPLVALLLGVLIGPHVLGWLDVPEPVPHTVLLEGTRVLLAASVMAAALRFRARALKDVAKATAVLLVVAMPAAALITGALGLLLGLPPALALLLGCCLSPTDPVLAASVVTGQPARRDLPGRLRRMLTTESGANDGLALPLVGVAIACVLPTQAVGGATLRVLVEVLGGVATGLVMGAATAAALRAARRRGELEPGPALVVTLLLALATLGVARVLEVAGVLAVFVAGLAYGAVLDVGRHVDEDQPERSAQDEVDEAVNRYAVLPVFVLLGVVLPWRDWLALGPAALLFAAGVLLVRRPPVVLALRRPLGIGVATAAFAGWFGPMGVSALFYLAHSEHEGATDPRLFAAGTLAITASVIAAGVSAVPLRCAFGRRTTTDQASGPGGR